MPEHTHLSTPWTGKTNTVNKPNTKVSTRITVRVVNREVCIAPALYKLPTSLKTSTGSFINKQVCQHRAFRYVNNIIRLALAISNENLPIKRPRQNLPRHDASGKSAGKESRRKDKNESKNFFHNAGKLIRGIGN